LRQSRVSGLALTLACRCITSRNTKRNNKLSENGREPTPLGYAVLGLIGIEPQSGYEVCKVFEETPMEVYSSSPGAIYPAIRRLKALKLVAPEKGGDGTARLAITARGREMLVRWLTRPITAGDVKRGLDQLMLRFAYMEHYVPRGELTRFLAAFNVAVEAHLGEVKRYYAQNAATTSLVGRLALEHGIDSIAANLRWGQSALAAIDSEARETGDKP